MTEESDETVERLTCPRGHMAKPDSDIEEGDECPHHECPHILEWKEISKHRLKLKDKLHSQQPFGGRELDIHDSLEFTPDEARYQADLIVSRGHNHNTRGMQESRQRSARRTKLILEERRRLTLKSLTWIESNLLSSNFQSENDNMKITTNLRNSTQNSKSEEKKAGVQTSSPNGGYNGTSGFCS